MNMKVFFFCVSCGLTNTEYSVNQNYIYSLTSAASAASVEFRIDGPSNIEDVSNYLTFFSCTIFSTKICYNNIIHLLGVSNAKAIVVYKGVYLCFQALLSTKSSYLL